MGAGHQRRLLCQEWSQVLGCQDEGIFGWRPPFDGVGLKLCKTDPGGDVGFVVDGGEDELGFGRKIENLGKIIEKLGCGGSNDWGLVLARVIERSI